MDWIHQFVNNENPSAPTAPQGTETAADNVENTLDVANVMVCRIIQLYYPGCLEYLTVHNSSGI